MDEFAGGVGVHLVEAVEDGGDASGVGAAEFEAGLEIGFGGSGRGGAFGFFGERGTGFFGGRFHFSKITQGADSLLRSPEAARQLQRLTDRAESARSTVT